MAREFACKDCGHIGTPDGYGQLRGNFLMSALLWTFVIPGMIYSIWRRCGKGTCPKCGGTSFASLNSEFGKLALEEFYAKEFAKNLPDKTRNN